MNFSEEKKIYTFSSSASEVAVNSFRQNMIAQEKNKALEIRNLTLLCIYNKSETSFYYFPLFQVIILSTNF